MTSDNTTTPPEGSIRQTRRDLPDFRNNGVIARVVLAANACGLAVAVARSTTLPQVVDRFLSVTITLEPPLIAVLTFLYITSDWLARLGYFAVLVLICAVAMGLSAAMAPVGQMLGQPVIAHEWAWNAAHALALVLLLAAYFDLRARAFSPALSEARLQALQARIRPHFLFNSLNAVLSLVRSDTRRAETALEDLADLFRTVISDPRQMVPLADEISLCKGYLSLESLRLGDRLQVAWDVDPRAEAVSVPAMLLQPLVENAVYHGVEPGIGPGLIEIRVRTSVDRVSVELRNPYRAEHQHRQGNRMALANIRERLLLHFDVEARLEAGVEGERYRIVITMPIRSGGGNP